ncbi:Tkp5 protein [Vanderwaltozyma polyspora DSM 70294]|uniref:Tkp5 protein n=1 Tax=Vanderwaltozyma polyspora (strain ATCC 22028 / DSM 70294 / BCRC 21397 / CBS 2163 / NBRC 10782 / NRRL Y-8283 / UCD 57-17) TaxID=436907 RepID=A7TR17_VANPO|nr:Tkp5 protein [Vanderwaltozyma polyspora DSM 70294]EDO15292.1 Tkp5 protein [Vanderwaltozyma polyspora DSM 70294]
MINYNPDTNISESEQAKWILSRAVSSHICGDISKFADFEAETKDNYIHGLSNQYKIHGHGTVEVPGFTLNEVVYIPDANVNLLSIKKLSSDNNVTFLFDDRHAYVMFYDRKKKKVGTFRRNLCYLDLN